MGHIHEFGGGDRVTVVTGDLGDSSVRQGLRDVRAAGAAFVVADDNQGRRFVVGQVLVFGWDEGVEDVDEGVRVDVGLGEPVGGLGSAWNYGLVTGGDLSLSSGGDLADPFTPATAPLTVTASAQRIEAWQADAQHVVTPLQDGPVASSAPVERVALILMGAARLRITPFPQTGGTREWAAPGAAFRLQKRNSGKVLGVDGMSSANSAGVVQFADNGTADHRWTVL